MDPKILIPVDDSPTAQKTIEHIIELRKRFSRNLTLLYVINQDQLAYRMIPDFQLDMVKKNAMKSGKALLDKYHAQLHEVGFTCELILETGDPRKIITKIANKQEFQLLVIGRHEGGGEIRDVIFGSVANHVLHNVSCPVLLF
ncbi:universal stress protein [Desulfopila sp. IMCC35008]|uniref:universal stress protein n=1 Tax=Desulfopila sp. IMCC35008 TaxID=2653858 RepID=UPI0013D47354|nr:universal stress protein [Desulfopila sp. IMCC35008]